VEFIFDMDINAINAMSDHLRQIQSATSSWDDESLGDEDVYSACDEMRSICVAILITIIRATITSSMLQYVTQIT
jgi:hypothetical protein